MITYMPWIKEFLKDRLAVTGLLILLLLVLFAIFAAYIAPHPDAVTKANMSQRLKSPVLITFGTDQMEGIF
jgi:ABC-type dipeptide/oligopeptide/nickel transport system permease subunit